MRDDIRRLIEQVENSGAIETIQNLENSGVIRALHEFENSATAKMIREIKKASTIANKALAENSSAIEQFRKFKQSTSFKTMESIQLKSFNSLTKLTEQVNSDYGAVTFFESYDYLSSKSGNIDKYIDDLSIDLTERVNSSPKDRLSTEFYASTILALLLFAVAYKAATDSENKIISKMNESEHIFTEKINDVVSNQLKIIEGLNESNFLTPDRKLNLRADSSAESDRIIVLVPSQKLRELDRERDWIKVECFDPNENRNVSGWVHSKFIIDYKSQTDLVE